MNSYWGAHVSTQKITETTESLKICYISYLFQDRTLTNWKGWWTASKPLLVARYWMFCWRVASKSTASVLAERGHFEHMQ